MSVKGSLLGILALGPAYGLQIRDELVLRAPHRSGINVGQIYGTIDRLLTAGMVVSAGLTEDNLPLYALSEAGREAGQRLRTTPEHPDAPEWTDMLDQALLTASLPGSESDVRSLLTGYRASWSRWASAEGPTSDSPATPFVLAARQEQAKAAHSWLDRVGSELASGRALERPARPERPRRGRRPQPDTAE